MSKLKNMRIVEISAFRAVTSGEGPLKSIFDTENGFACWLDSHNELIRQSLYEPLDFLWHEKRDINRSVWAWPILDHVTESDTEPYDIIQFPGGTFLVATADESDEADLNETVNCMMDWINGSSVFTYGDFPESGMCNMPNPNGSADKVLGIAQQQIFLPLKLRED